MARIVTINLNETKARNVRLQQYHRDGPLLLKDKFMISGMESPSIS